MLTGFGFVSCLIKGIILLHLRYIELYSYFITFVWFLLYENGNCALIVSPSLNAILYYVLPHRNFQKHLAPKFFKHRHQEVITKVDETSFSFVENAVARKESLAFSDNLNTLNLQFGRLISPKPHSCVEIDQVNILINALINSIGNKTLCVEAKKFLRYCAYSLNRPIKKIHFWPLPELQET